jgi:hypothetical protein
MAPICSSYIIPFNPLGAPGPTILTTTQEYNKMFKHLKWGSAVSPYPNPASVYHQSAITDPVDDMFEDLFLNDLYVLVIESLVNSTNNNNRVQANKRISRHRLLHDSNVSGNLRGLLECGVQVRMDAKEVQDNTIEVSIGYTSSIGTNLWSKIKVDRAKVGPGYGVVVVDFG